MMKENLIHEELGILSFFIAYLVCPLLPTTAGFQMTLCSMSLSYNINERKKNQLLARYSESQLSVKFARPPHVCACFLQEIHFFPHPKDVHMR